ncbi:hypothetical protein F8S09_15265 [Deinococcus sp. SDU3-2]|uniref:Uncharacterized protein n=1 Tax=Deinococcus terrestris TaxID=2651870 RepID=A0A7X1NYB2_9DEIO|nr:hypothetical protein [Deinococcus terrestris]MPY68017.1 hypothetical protein [Deinococcus terrestris]
MTTPRSVPRRWRLAAALTCAVLTGAAPALQRSPGGTARIDGHAAGTFDTLNSPAGFAGGLAWGPDGTAYTLDGTRLLYRWNAQTGRPLSRQVLTLPSSLPGAKADYGPRLLLDGYRADGGALTGPFIRVRGYKKGTPYQTAYTLRADGRAVLGDICASSQKHLVGCSQWYGVTVLPAQKGRATLRLSGREGPVSDITLPAGQVLDVEPSPDGTRVAALRTVEKRDYDPNAALYLDVATRDGKVLSRQVLGSFGVRRDGEPQVRWVDTGRLLTATPRTTSPYSPSGHQVNLWSLSGQGPRWTVGSGELRDAVPSPDGTLFLTVRDGSVPEVRRVSDGAFVRPLGTPVTASVPLPGGSALVALDTGDGQGELRVVRPGGQGRRLGGPGLEGVTRLVVSPDGQFIAAARSESVAVLDRAGRTLHTFALPENVYWTELGFSGPRTLFARLENGGDDWQGRTWDAVTGRLLSQEINARPVGTIQLRTEVRQRPDGGSQSRLSVADQRDRVVWQEAWRSESRPYVLPSPDGRAVVRGVARRSKVQPEQADLYLYRLDPRTGQADPGLTLRTGDPEEAYRGLRLLDYAPDRRHVLLFEASGDGCGSAFYGLRLADLETRREVKLPSALTTGLTRLTGCGYPTPWPTAAFTPEGTGLLVRDGNALNWWRLQ